MNIIKKVIYATLLSLSSFSLTTSLALADGKTDAEATCPGCHGVIINNIQAVGTGGRSCVQRTATEWEATINRMNGKGCGVPAGSIAGIASYLACVTFPSGICMPTSTTSSTSTSTSTTSSSNTTTSSTTTSTFFERCSPWNQLYISANPTSLSFTATEGGAIPASQSLTVSASVNQSFLTASWSVGAVPAWLSISPTGGSQGSTQVTASIISTQLSPGVYTATIYFTARDGCPYDYAGTSLTVTFTIDPSTSSTTTSSTSTVATTTTTTLCNSYVNGTTQFPYSGSGSCHGFAIDDMSGAHIVRDQAYCKKHMSHYNSKGNHVHAYPHPSCM